MKSPRKAI